MDVALPRSTYARARSIPPFTGVYRTRDQLRQNILTLFTLGIIMVCTSYIII